MEEYCPQKNASCSLGSNTFLSNCHIGNRQYPRCRHERGRCRDGCLLSYCIKVSELKRSRRSLFAMCYLTSAAIAAEFSFPTTNFCDASPTSKARMARIQTRTVLDTTAGSGKSTLLGSATPRMLTLTLIYRRGSRASKRFSTSTGKPCV